MSKSGGIKIAKRDWGVAGNLRIARKTLPPNFDITWKTYPMFADTFAPGPKGTETVLLQGVKTPDGAEFTLTDDSGEGLWLRDGKVLFQRTPGQASRGPVGCGRSLR